MAEQDPVICLRGIRKSYGTLPVLRGVDLDVPHGQTVSVIGPSGSGKSTLLRLLMMLDAPDAGELQIDGEQPWVTDRHGSMRADKAALRRARGRVGMVFQHFNLFPHLSALENVMEAPVGVLGFTREKAAAHALDYLEQVGLADKAHVMPGQLSGGQKQRVAIARALAMQPRIMLFDEVTSALDPELVSGILALLQRLAEPGDMTMLIVTHHMHFAESCADRVLFFEDGVIAEDGPPAELFNDPRYERTRRFAAAVSGR
jgi:polar amino acid transport system ATP-binding protein